MTKKDLIEYWKSTGTITDIKLLDAFMKVDREDFILKNCIDQAYEDNPLPILAGQTISQPTTVMLMIKFLKLKESDKVLEIGSGSGYNAAIMSYLCQEVFSIEIIDKLAKFAQNNTRGLKNIHIINSDGGHGYKKSAPYDAIIVTCAAPEIPSPLIEQLADTGRLVAPVGPLGFQTMIRLTKKGNKIKREDLGNFVFVPLKGDFGF